MKLDQYKGTEAQLSGITANNFQFQMNAKMYDIVMSKMYKDKPGSVIRELSCNALDAHREAGRPDVPFEIELPTWLQKTFSIRDYGTGIPHDQFEDIYTNVGASTKEDSNDDIGAYGLGSKTPFSLTDTYLIENWESGKKSTWLCFKSEGFPKVTQLTLEDSTEPCGLKVSFDFESDNVREFQNSILKQLSFFPVKPKITGGDRQNWDAHWPKVPDYTGKNYFYYESNEWVADGIVLMGPVAYPFSKGDIGIERWGDSRSVLFKKPLCIVASLGDVDVPPSRETLEFTDKTKKYIDSVLETIRAEYRKTFDADLLKMNNFKEAWLYLADANKDLLPYKTDDLIMLASGVTYDYGALSGRWYPLPEYSMIKGRHDLKKKFSAMDRYHLSPGVFKSTDTKFYVDDLGPKGAQHLADNNQTFPELRSTYIVKTGLKSTEKLPKHKDAAEKAIKVLKDNHGIDATLVSALIGFPVIAPRAKSVKGGAVKVDQIFNVEDSRRGSPYKLKTYKGKSITDIPDTGYFVEIHGATLAKDPCRETYSKLKVCASYLKGKGIPLYFVRTRSIKKLDENKCKPLDLLYSEVSKYLRVQDELSEKREDILGAMPISILRVLRDLPELRRKDDKDLKIVMRYQQMIQGIKLDDSINYSYTQYLYKPSNQLGKALGKQRDLNKLKALTEKIETEYNWLWKFEKSFLGYMGKQTDFIKGIQEVLRTMEKYQSTT